MKIIKRDGRIANFDQNKIIDAVLAAFKAVDGEITDYAYTKAKNISNYILDFCKEYKRTAYEEWTNSTEKEWAGKPNLYLNVEQIQDLVEKGLMSTKRKDVAKEYITYRKVRDIERTKQSELRKTVLEKIIASNPQNQNANVDEESFGGRVGEASSVQMKDIALNEIMSKMARDNHLNNEIYVHDLDSYAVGMHNCLSIPFDDLLSKGFNVKQTDVRPANSVNTAFQLVAVIFQLQSLQQFGGVSATHLDWTMVPYVRKSFYKHYKEGVKYLENLEWSDSNMPDSCENLSIDSDFYKESYTQKVYQYAMDMTIKETNQAVEGMYHNLNTLQSRSGNQLKRMAG